MPPAFNLSHDQTLRFIARPKIEDPEVLNVLTKKRLTSSALADILSSSPNIGSQRPHKLFVSLLKIPRLRSRPVELAYSTASHPSVKPFFPIPSPSFQAKADPLPQEPRIIDLFRLPVNLFYETFPPRAPPLYQTNSAAVQPTTAVPLQ